MDTGRNWLRRWSTCKIGEVCSRSHEGTSSAQAPTWSQSNQLMRQLHLPESAEGTAVADDLLPPKRLLSTFAMAAVPYAVHSRLQVCRKRLTLPGSSFRNWGFLQQLSWSVPSPGPTLFTCSTVSHQEVGQSCVWRISGCSSKQLPSQQDLRLESQHG